MWSKEVGYLGYERVHTQTQTNYTCTMHAFYSMCYLIDKVAFKLLPTCLVLPNVHDAYSELFTPNKKSRTCPQA